MSIFIGVYSWGRVVDVVRWLYRGLSEPVQRCRFGKPGPEWRKGHGDKQWAGRAFRSDLRPVLSAFCHAEHPGNMFCVETFKSPRLRGGVCREKKPPDISGGQEEYQWRQRVLLGVGMTA
ncbi:TPA: hypothetical protein ACHJX8_003760 [Yersinia enterocolitica]|uniref:hypothetical protein n=1 Tax=Yersinia TaxID=629 RepID=UPI00100AA96A|nr:MULTISPECIES: hypothetical protein [Yersinia]MCB5310603.1 hypothetical protein [Yersinia massiliensis]